MKKVISILFCGALLLAPAIVFISCGNKTQSSDSDFSCPALDEAKTAISNSDYATARAKADAAFQDYQKMSVAQCSDLVLVYLQIMENPSNPDGTVTDNTLKCGEYCESKDNATFEAALKAVQDPIDKSMTLLDTYKGLKETDQGMNELRQQMKDQMESNQ